MAQIDFFTTYKPAIANPFVNNETYANVVASLQMQPYIRCFWGSMSDFNPHTTPFYDNTLLVPDTCFDLIFIRNHRLGFIKMLFTGLNSRYSIDGWDEQDTNISIFAIRFNFWTMNIISKFPMAETLNQTISHVEIFPDIEDLCEKIFSVTEFYNRAALAEQYIKNLINLHSISDSFFNGVDFIIRKKGVGTLKQLSEHLCYSERHIQRIFFEAVGITPKHLMNLVRYQSIWQETIASGKINYMDMIYKYGYTDQSHLISDFKKYHSLTPQEALKRISE